MADRPIIFSAPMVRALLEGRKTQTRRLLRAAVPDGHFVDRCPYVSTGWSLWTKAQESHVEGCTCQPFRGVPWHAGDRLWVREAWAQPTCMDPGPTFWRADYPACVPPHYENVPPAESIRWRPSIHMPRSASRLTLLVTEVRVQHLHDISRDDVLAEGAPLDPDYRDTSADGSNPHMVAIGVAQWQSPRAWYHKLWDSLHGPGSWDANPDVVALTFQVTHANIDTLISEAA
ncbi:hypothetical protein [Muricoccus aerilatus]|uniref:hypothetical protein n=1 Tax=Muricoccus aerilatus TaxID=452982 RepID=UPI0005C24866|nr:hypothetical protein [Roseomonas aerilata]